MMIPAVPGTLFLLPFFDEEQDLQFETHVVLGWRQNPFPDQESMVLPVLAVRPSTTSPFAGIKHGDATFISAPGIKTTFADFDAYRANVRAEMEAYNQENSISGEAGQSAALPEATQPDPSTDPSQVYGLDSRPYGETDDPVRNRRTPEETEQDKAYLAAVEACGVTIRSANSQWKKTPSRAAVLAALAGRAAPAAKAPEAAAPSTPSYADEDLL